ncbi:S8 family peptidase [Patescibacteria group bacterium]|nr:S8 family peptidase [Patescibacteria group bacterium]
MPNEQYPHIKLVRPPEEQIFSSTSSGGRTRIIPERNREAHSAFLISQFRNALQEIESEQNAYDTSRNGMYIEFKSDPGTELFIQSLENMKKKIRLLNVREVKEATLNETTGETEEKIAIYATVFVPKENSNFFLRRIEAYASEIDPRSNKPKNYNLINSIANIRKALLIDSFWSDLKELIPADESKWCEIWLNVDSENVIPSFEELLIKHGIQANSGTIIFPERAVKIVNVNRQQLELLSRHSDYIAEYRQAKESALLWTEMTNRDQSEWAQDLVNRLNIDDQANVSICILDHGVNNGHPLLSPILANADCQSIRSEWGTHDHHPIGHGTLMSGIAAYGDLEECMASAANINLNHRLESVKIIPLRGENPPELWGHVTSQGISLAEINAPDRKRIICMALTASDTRDRGRPSSWSAAVDNITSGAINGQQRLVLISAGNAENFARRGNYPDSLLTDSIHDPAQSWNALTVGAYTSLYEITDPDLAGYTPIAPNGGLSPFTTTSSVWEDKWPIKPEIVMEGGNLAEDHTLITECPDLGKLTTNHEPLIAQLAYFNMTSLATAQASWFAAQIQVAYPSFWPETIRALMVHSATWTDTLLAQFRVSLDNKSHIKSLMRICGYGVPSLQRALYSASNSLTLIAEAEIMPFYKVGSNYKTKDMHLYDLPWPTEALQSLPPETEVEMRITLSYFIEPGPGEIGWKDKYRYASHILRFDLNSPGEEKNDFIQRINRAARDEDNEHPGTESAASHWIIGARIRNKGSIHSDIWKGTAADLAASNLIAVYPGVGWWRERKNLNKWNKRSRYSLIVSISTPSQEIDIYTPVAVQVSSRIPVAVEI